MSYKIQKISKEFPTNIKYYKKPILPSMSKIEPEQTIEAVEELVDMSEDFQNGLDQTTPGMDNIIVNKMAKLANELDSIFMIKYADVIDNIILKLYK